MPVPSGMNMMLKTLGIDPEEIKASLIQAKNEIMAQVTSVNDRLARIETALGIAPATEGETVNHDGNNHSNKPVN